MHEDEGRTEDAVNGDVLMPAAQNLFRGAIRADFSIVEFALKARWTPQRMRHTESVMSLLTFANLTAS